MGDDIMTAIQQQAIQLIRQLPDEKIQAIITLATDEISLLSFRQKAASNNKKSALDRLEKIELNLPSDFDADKELEQAIGEKYGFAG